jgi:hypothetical protein
VQLLCPRSDTLQPTAVPAELGHREDRTDVASAGGFVAAIPANRAPILNESRGDRRGPDLRARSFVRQHTGQPNPLSVLAKTALSTGS